MNNTAMRGQFEGDAHYDVLYAVARRHQEEAHHRAAMDRLVRNIEKREQPHKPLFALHKRPTGALQTIVLTIGRWGRMAMPGTCS